MVFKKPLQFLFVADDGIDALREKLMLDLKTEVDRIKDAILGKEVAEYNNHVEMNDAQPPPVTGEMRWNLRKRRAPVAGDDGVWIYERRGGGGGSSRVSPEKKERRPVNFSPMLSKKEIEVDFMRIVGHLPPRRPKKRPRKVQKQLDTLFPGQCLSEEVCADSYMVPDDAGKVCECYTVGFGGGGGGGSSRVSPEKKERRPVKFSPMLSKKEIEVDFMRIVGHLPPRRPKKRPRKVQKQLDTLFPGHCLSEEVCADSYMIPDDAGKVCECYTVGFGF